MKIMITFCMEMLVVPIFGYITRFFDEVINQYYGDITFKLK